MHRITSAVIQGASTSGAAAAGPATVYEQPAQVAQALVRVDNAGPNDDSRPAPQDTNYPFFSCPAHGPALHLAPTQTGQAVVPEDASGIIDATGVTDVYLTLLKRLGTAQHPTGVYKALSARFGPDDTGLEFIPDTIGRFPEIPTARDTRVIRVWEDKLEPLLAGNFVMVDGERVAIATQYPMPLRVESYLDTLTDLRVSVVLVLASDDEIDNSNGALPRYFGDKPVPGADEDARSQVVRRQVGKLKVEYLYHTKPEKLDGGLEYVVHTMRVRKHEKEYGNSVRKKVHLCVIHVRNWPVHTSLTPGPAVNHGGVTTVALGQLVAKVQELHHRVLEYYRVHNSRSLGVPGRMLPVVHGVSGVGRTGVFIAAYKLLADDTLSVEAVVTAMRESRSPHMVLTNDQLRALVLLAEKNGNPILPSEAPGSVDIPRTVWTGGVS